LRKFTHWARFAACLHASICTHIGYMSWHVCHACARHSADQHPLSSPSPSGVTRVVVNIVKPICMCIAVPSSAWRGVQPFGRMRTLHCIDPLTKLRMCTVCICHASIARGRKHSHSSCALTLCFGEPTVCMSVYAESVRCVHSARAIGRCVPNSSE
jgi:hypothetical protein